MARQEDYDLDVPDPPVNPPPGGSDPPTRGDLQNSRHLKEKVVQVGPFTGTVRIVGSNDGVNFPVVGEVAGDPAGDGEFVPIPYMLVSVAVDVVSLTGDKPTVKLSGHRE